MITVSGRGPIPCKFLVLGEAPGSEEAKERKPFVGPTGREQENLFIRNHISPSIFRYNNIIQEYTPGNPNPTQSQIEYWTPILTVEIHKVNPYIILAVGAFATRWLLGSSADLETCHGMPFKPGAFDASISYRCPSHTIIIPCYHPAFGLHSDSGHGNKSNKASEARALISWDYSRACDFIRDIQADRKIQTRSDEWKNKETYIDVTGDDLRFHLLSCFHEPRTVIGIDTEGEPSSPWSIQVSPEPGTGLTLRYSKPDFQVGISAIQSLVDDGSLIILHQAQTPQGCCYDFTMAEAMGLHLREARIWDTMYAAYLLRIESKGLKPLSLRWLGVNQTPYVELIGGIGKQKQIEYLHRAADLTADWPKPETRIVRNPDGTYKPYNPKAIHKTILGILSDIAKDKRNNKNEPVDIPERWKGIDKIQRRRVIRYLGKLPYGTIDDLPLEDAIRYSSADSDLTLRLYYQLEPEICRLNLSEKMSLGNSILPIIWEMQTNGMPASKSKFRSLYGELLEEMAEIQSNISRLYFSGKPFNPNSRPQTETLLRRRGLADQVAKTTATGLLSTAEDSIAHLQFIDPAIEELFKFRERSNTAKSHCNSVVERLDSGDNDNSIDNDLIIVRANFKAATTVSSRLSSEKFKDEYTPSANLLATPAHSDTGHRLRSCYEFPENLEDDDSELQEVFGSWDLSQIEMRFAASLSSDPLMCEAFSKGLDFHQHTASLIFKTPFDKITKKQRQAAKTVNFLILYGGGPDVLLTEFRTKGIEDWDKNQCRKMLMDWFKIYSGITRCIKDTSDKARADGGIVRDFLGMIRYLPGLFSEDFKIKSESERECFSLRVQGGAQEMIQNSMRWLDGKVLTMRKMKIDIKWRLQIHDEFVLSFPKYLWDIINELALEALSEHSGIKLSVPVLANGSMSRSWGGLKE